jgi:antirestriction protein ArdC
MPSTAARPKSPSSTTRKPASKKKRRQVSEAECERRKQKAEARREEAVAVLDAGVDHVADDPEALRAYLEFQARFHRYSHRNALLLFEQTLMRGASASHFMGYQAWKSVGRQVRKGEKGYMIFAPVTRKLYGEDAAEAGVKDGTSKLVSFRVATVFDMNQTDVVEGQEETALRYVSPIGRLTSAEHEPLLRVLETLPARLGYSLRRYDGTEQRAGGYCNYTDREIGLLRCAPDQQAKTLAHELAHAIAHGEADPETDGRDDCGKGPAMKRAEIAASQAELQAEGAAYVACYSLGLDTSSYSMPYLRHWCESETPEERREEVRAQLGAIDRIARRLLSMVEEAQGEGAEADEVEVEEHTAQLTVAGPPEPVEAEGLAA